ncbi:hypothetical protein ACHAWF_007756 [Thalassiosira exigua]
MLFHNPQGIKLVNETEYEQLKSIAAGCARDMHKCKNEANQVERKFVCQKAAECEQTLSGPLKRLNISDMDITKPCVHDEDPNCDPKEKLITTFLNSPSTKEILGVPAHVTWEECVDPVINRWSNYDMYADFTPYISELLDEGLPVLIYSGDKDANCNYFGNRAVALKLEWKHGDDFRAAEDRDWNDGGGLARSSHGLSFLQVHGAGHMVPQDQPEQALTMIAQFLSGEEF